MAVPSVLAIGASHLNAIAAGYERLHAEQDLPLGLTALQLNLPKYNPLIIRKPSCFDVNNALKEDIDRALETSDPVYIVYSLGGNVHNVVGLVQHPVPFDVFLPGEVRRRRISPHTKVVPYAMMEAMFAHRNGGFKIALEVLRGYLKRPSVQILPPPPIASEEHIRRRPGPFKEALEQGKIAPVALRQRLWRTYCNFLRSISEPLDIKCLEPPADAIDQTGCLATAYYGADPTHANTEYGKLVFRQILEECGVA